MKDFIVLIATVILGVFIFNLIAGPREDSILAFLANSFVIELNRRNYVNMVDLK